MYEKKKFYKNLQNFHTFIWNADFNLFFFLYIYLKAQIPLFFFLNIYLKAQNLLSFFSIHLFEEEKNPLFTPFFYTINWKKSR